MSQRSHGVSFSRLNGGVIAVPSVSWAADSRRRGRSCARIDLDHIILALANDLDRGIDLVRSETGGRPAIGGVHPAAARARTPLARRAPLFGNIARTPSNTKLVNFPQIAAHDDPRLTLGRPSSRHRCHSKATWRNKIAFQGPADAQEGARGTHPHLENRQIFRRPPRPAPFFIEWSATTSILPRTLQSVAS